MIRILLADNRPLWRAGFQAVLQPVRDLQLLPGVAHQSWPSLCQQHRADVLLINAHIPGLQIESLLTEMAITAPETHVLLLLEAGVAALFDLHKILQTGRDSAILSDDPLDLLFDALHAVGQGKPWFSPRLLGQLLKPTPKPFSSPPFQLGRLTDREWDVLQQVAQGLSDREIALRFHLSPRTVSYHLGNILRKLQVSSRVEAILWWQREVASPNKI